MFKIKVEMKGNTQTQLFRHFYLWEKAAKERIKRNAWRVGFLVSFYEEDN